MGLAGGGKGLEMQELAVNLLTQHLREKLKKGGPRAWGRWEWSLKFLTLRNVPNIATGYDLKRCKRWGRQNSSCSAQGRETEVVNFL